MPLALATSLPLCWNCHVAATFRRMHPELVTDRDDSTIHVTRRRPASSKGSEELAHVIDQQFGLFERGEMTAARHRRPSHQVVSRLHPLPRRRGDLLREQRAGRRDRHAPLHGRRDAVLVVDPRRRRAVSVTQYMVMFVRRSSFEKRLSMLSPQSHHAWNFSTIHDARPAGESVRPTPSVCGFVPWICWYARSFSMRVLRLVHQLHFGVGHAVERVGDTRSAPARCRSSGAAPPRAGRHRAR